jgi:hypothetical protein
MERAFDKYVPYCGRLEAAGYSCQFEPMQESVILPRMADYVCKANPDWCTRRPAGEAIRDMLATGLIAEILYGKGRQGRGPRIGKSGLCNSFVPGTEVLMADGTKKPIEKVKVGDKVLATDPKTGKTVAKKVVASFDGDGYTNLIQVTVDTDGKRGDKTGVVIATEHHLFWDQGHHAWVRADELTKLSHLRTPTGADLTVITAVSYPGNPTVHDLTVEDIHTFYVEAGTTPVLVHNAGCRWKLGDDYSMPDKNGNSPSMSTMRKRFWKNEAAEPYAADQYGAANISRMKRGSAPQRQRPDGSWESMELSHEPIPERDGDMLLTPRWPQDHVIMDPGGYRRLPPGY